MAVFKPQPDPRSADTSGWDRFGRLDMSGMGSSTPTRELGQDDDQDSGYGEEPAQTKGYYGEHKGLDFLQDDKGLFQEGKYAGPGLGDVWSSIKDAGGRMGAYFNKPKPTVNPDTPPPVINNQPVIAKAGKSNVVSGENTEGEPNISNVSTNVAEHKEGILPAALLSKVDNPENPGGDIKSIQSMLAEEGLLDPNIDIDGDWGPRSIEAMQAWMAKNPTNQGSQTQSSQSYGRENRPYGPNF